MEQTDHERLKSCYKFQKQKGPLEVVRGVKISLNVLRKVYFINSVVRFGGFLSKKLNHMVLTEVAGLY